MDIKKLIKLQNAIIKAHQKIKTVQNDNNLQTKEIKNEFKKEFNVLNKALELLSKELNSFIKKEELSKQNEELKRLEDTLSEVNKNINDKISKIQLKHGKDGINGIDGKDGINGKDGKDGINGRDGKNGKDGSNGLSAYEIAVKQGYKGTEKEWIDHITNNGGVNYGGQIAAINQRLNEIPMLETDGEGNKYLSDDGTYKEASQQDLSKYALKTDIPDVSNFATKDEIPPYTPVPTSISAFDNDVGYINYNDLMYNIGVLTKGEANYTNLLNIEYVDSLQIDYEQNKIYIHYGVPYGFAQVQSDPITMQLWRFESGSGGPGEVFTYQLANDSNLVSEYCYWSGTGIDYEAEVQPMPELMTFDTISSIGQDTITTSMGAIYRKYQEIKFYMSTGGFRQLTSEDDLTPFLNNNVSNWCLDDKLNKLKSELETQIGDIDTLLIALNTGSGV